MEDQSVIPYGLVAAATLVYLWRWLRPNRSQMPHIPAMGPTTPILSYWGAMQWLVNGVEITKEGYKKYKGRAFKVATFNRWIAIVSGPKLVEELRRAADDELSFIEAANETLEIRLTAGPNIAENMYHVPIVRSQLTRSLHILFPAIRDEVVTACNDQLPNAEEWVSVVAFDFVMQVVARTSNRIFIGLPLCRHPEYIKLAVRFTIDLVLAANLIQQFPEVLKPFAARVLTRVSTSVDEGVKYLGGEIQRRLDLVEQYGTDYPDKPIDMLAWLIDNAEGEERTVRNLVLRILVLDFAAIHTSTMAFTHVFYELANNPEYVKILRREVETITQAEGWSKASIEKMHKVDSMLKECQRYYSTGGVTMLRRAMKDFTFSDGTLIPEGCFVGTAVLPMQRDSDFYEDAETFKPWRFSDAREKEGDSARFSMVNTSVEYHTFGHGRHACPGRFFAANEMKMLLIELVTKYEMKLEKEGVIPPPVNFGSASTPNQKAKILLRKRRN